VRLFVLCVSVVEFWFNYIHHRDTKITEIAQS